MSDDNTHFEALVVAAEFSGKRLLARHQMVYKCLGSLVGNEIHALSIIAMTPDEWRGLRVFRAWLLGIARNRVRLLAEYASAQKRGGGDVAPLGNPSGSARHLRSA